MLKVTYKEKSGDKLRYLFNLHAGTLSLPGQIYERTGTNNDKYFWNFAGKFPWEVADRFTPFKFEHDNRDMSAILFYGVPQAMLKLLYDFTPKIAEKYKTDNNRNCGNCEFLRYSKNKWDEWWERPTSERFQPPPSSLYSCAVSGSSVDHLPHLTAFKGTKTALLKSLRENSCDGHTRRAYKVDISPEARESDGALDRWVPSEYKRLQLLNPETISFSQDKSKIHLPGGLMIGISKE